LQSLPALRFISDLRVQRYCFFLNLQKKSDIFFKKSHFFLFYALLLSESTYLCMSKYI